MQNFFKNLSKRGKIITGIIALVFLIAIAYSVSTLIYRSGKTKVIIKVAPNDATITFNDTRVANNSTIWLTPGDYHVKAHYNEHLTTHEEDITVGSETYELYTILNAVDEEGQAFIEKHQQEYTNIEGLIGYLADKEGAKIKEKYPILQHLPINNRFYSISYEYDKNNVPLITVRASLEDIDTAVKKLHVISNNLSEQNITFDIDDSHFSYYLPNSNTDITSFIHTAYQLDNSYLVGEVIELKDGYYYTSIYQYDSYIGEDYAHFKVLLKKNSNGEWTVISSPQPLFTAYNMPNIDKSILDLANSY